MSKVICGVDVGLRCGRGTAVVFICRGAGKTGKDERRDFLARFFA